MGLFSGLLAGIKKDVSQVVEKSLTPVSGHGWISIIQEPFSGAWQQNAELTHEQTMVFHAVFTCISLVSQDIGKLGIELKTEKNGILETVQDNRFSFLQKPNKFQTWQQFAEYWVISKLRRGNTYVLKIRDLFGRVIGLYVLNPDLVMPLISDEGEVFYQVNTDRLINLDSQIILPASEIIHDRFNCLFHPLVGLSPIVASGVAAGQGLAIQNNSSSFFGNMSRPSGILVAPGPIDSGKATEIRTAWNLNYSAGNYGKTAILGDGMKYEPMSVSAADAQMLDQLKFSGELVCSTFHVPPFKVGLGSIPVGQKTGDLNEIYYSDCLQSLIEAIENLLTQDLGLKDIGLSVEFNIDSLIRMDSVSQMNYLAAATGGGIMAANEARKKINLRPVVGGESPMVQQQNFSLAALAKRDALADPFNAPTAVKSVDGMDMLIKRINDLEARPTLQYKGVFEEGESYQSGDMVTYQGSVWHCEKSHLGAFDHEAFKLAVKKGRDAK